MKKILHIALIITGSILILAGILLTFILVNSPGKSEPFHTAEGKKIPGSIAEIETVSINGLDQRMIIRGRDTTNPVLLYLHGGPGDPEFPFVHRFNSAIEDIFTVCYWEQRGAGLSYSDAVSPESMTLSQFVEDAGKVSEYLIRRFGQRKIYVLGHSWGTLLGSFTIKKYPEYFNAFIAVGQVGDQVRAEKISYDFVLRRAKELNDRRALSILESIGAPPYKNSRDALEKMLIERKYVIRYGGAVKKGKFYREAAKQLIFCKEYTFKDKINYLKGMQFSKKYLWDAVMSTNLFDAIPDQQIPVYILQGVSDYETSYIVAKEYFDSLKAPVKKFYTFENSAHSPIFEEPEKFEKIIKEILSGQ